MPRRSHIVCVFSLLFALASSLSGAPPAGADRAKWFEAEIRPLLAKHCVACHGPKKSESDIRLDHRSFMVSGMESDILVPGKPDKSRLLQVVAYDEFDIQMPPAGKLPQRERDLLREWIESGAYWPDEPIPSDGATADPKTHWSWQRIAHPTPPPVDDVQWLETPLDAFILARLEAANLTPSPEADRATLIRRLFVDLLGVPPTLDEVRAFAADTRPDAWSRLVDRTLADPRYGERWGRHWLDIARYADTKGYVFQEDRRYPFAYTFRNYVIDSLNADKPFDRFVVEQLAADRLGLPDRSEELAALGFLTVGRRFRNSTHDIIDDRIDVVSRGLLGLTIACARCHDHKYDPIGAADYYALYGVFASSEEPDDLPLVGMPPQTEGYRKFAAERDKHQATLERVTREELDKTADRFRGQVHDFLIRVVELDHKPQAKRPEFRSGTPNGTITNELRRYLKSGTPADHTVFGVWKQFARVPAAQFAAESHGLRDRVLADARVPNRLAEALRKRDLASMYDVAEAYGAALASAHSEWKTLVEQAKQKQQPVPTSLPDSGDEALRLALYASGSPFDLSDNAPRGLVDRASRNRIQKEQQKLDKFIASSQHAPPRAMVLRDKESLYNPYVFERGNAGRRGPSVPRRFPELLSDVRSEPFADGSGRRELAEAIVDAENPLTARVLANRIWRHHFGTAIVPTADDFGLRSDPPSHPELLDYLAQRLIDNGWSLKALHREILLSAAWRQSSRKRESAANLDPENRLYWRQNRRRIGFEAMRDSLLAVSGGLVDSPDAPPVPYTSGEANTRRTIYLTVDRNNLPNLFRAFDFANPDQTTAKRSETSVPQQTLFTLNSPFVINAAKRVAASVPVSASAADVVTQFYLRVHRREPTSEERELAAGFLSGDDAGTDTNGLTKREQLAQVLLLSNEFFFVD